MSDPLSKLLRRLSPTARRFPSGTFLFHRQDSVEVLHLVEAGEVHLLRHQREGALLILQRAGSGALLAEASLFSESYHCDAVAVQPTVTLSVPKPVLRNALTADPHVAEAWTAHLAHELQATRLRAEILSLRTVSERLDAWLGSTDGMLPDKGAWKTLASELGITPEALYRELGRRRGKKRSSAPRDAL